VEHDDDAVTASSVEHDDDAVTASSVEINEDTANAYRVENEPADFWSFLFDLFGGKAIFKGLFWNFESLIW